MTKLEKIICEVSRLASNMYRLGWDERNGGNISRIIDDDEIDGFIDVNDVKRTIPIAFDASQIAGKMFIVTGTGKYFKNVEIAPQTNLGIIRICPDGKNIDILWGYEDGSKPTSELPAHLMTHIERLKKDSQHKVVIHTHATNTLAMTYVHSLDEREFTKTLWQMCTECIVVFPDGVSVLPWMLCGNDEIGRKTAEKMRDTRLVVWAQHGIFGTGKSLDEAFGLIETVEKAAEIYIKIMNMPRINTITDEQLKLLANAFGVQVHEGYLD